MTRFLTFALCSLLALMPGFARAESIILDSEFWDYCNKLVKPLRPSLPHTDDVSFVLMPGDDINAFVTPEKVVHLNAGLFLNASGSSDVQGVLGHEMGHISSQHFLRSEDNANAATVTGIAGVVVGIGAAIAGAPQAAAAGMSVGQAGAIAQMLKFSRTHEREADQRAIAALGAANLSVKGMVHMFEKLRVDSQLSYGSMPQYLMTHPLPEDRIQSLQRAAAVEKAPPPVEKDPAFERMAAKVYGLTHTPGATLRRYGTGSDEPSRYARVVAIAMQGKIKEAEAELAPLVTAHPQDVFYKEMGAQLALQRGDLEAARQGFAAVLQQRPDLVLVRYQLAEVLRNQNKPQEALGALQQVTREFQVWANPWESLGIVYGQMGNLPMSHLALTQSAIYSYDRESARQQLLLAKKYLKEKPNPEAEAWAASLENIVEGMGRNG